MTVRTFVLSLCFAASLHAQQAAIRRLDGSSLSQADAEQFAKATLSAQHVTGAQIAILNRGKLVWSYAYGLRHKDPDLPMDRDTTTWAASITKAVFATYVMQQVERHQFDLDKPIAQQLPKPLDEYEAYRETGSELVKDPRWPSVTPRMLLSHTGGLLNLASKQEPDKKLRLHGTPGSRYSYSGDGMNLVQFVLEQQQGRPLDQLMQDALFGPLGMTRTSEIYQKRFADDVSDRFDQAEAFHAQTRRFPARASGNMTTSAEDLARFAAALLGGQIISAKTQQQMLTPQIAIRTVHQFGSPDDSGSGAEAASVGLAYGLGWGLLTTTRFGPAFFKEGHGDGAQNYMICFQRSRDCMIVLTNSDNGELAFRPLLEALLGDSVTPWEWEAYTPSAIAASRANQ